MRVVPAAHGWGWLITGWGLFRATPGLWTVTVLCYFMIISLAAGIPLVGPVAIALTAPAFSVSFMVICDTVRRREPLRPSLIFSGFRQNPQGLVTLGGLYLVAMLLIFGMAVLAAKLFGVDASAVQRPAPGSVADGRAFGVHLATLLMALPVLMAFWFAPVLTAWNGMSAGKSLFFSFFACLGNWRAFLAYGTALAVLGMLLVSLITLLATLVGAPLDAARGMLLGAILMLMPTLFGSFYAAYRDVFADAAPPRPEQR